MCSLHNRAPFERRVEPAADGPGRGLALLAERRSGIAALCQLYGVNRLTVFGAALHPDFDPVTTAFDFAADFADIETVLPTRQYIDFRAALASLMGQSVELVDVSSLPDSHSKRRIERTQRLLYARAN